MTTISIIGSGNMAAAIGTRAAQHGHTVELLSRNTAKAQTLADQIGNSATVGTFGARPAGEIVIVAVLYDGVVDAVTKYGDALAGKILVDISNPFNADASGLVTTSSAAQEIAAVGPRERPRREGAEHDLRPRARQGHAAGRVHRGRQR